MHYKIDTSIQIPATPETIWNVLTDFESYGEWNPFIQSIEGIPAKGEQLIATIDGMKMKPTLLDVTTNKKLEWLGSLLFKGIFDGQHCFELIDNEDGTTTFNHSEQFNGILVGLLKSKLDNEIKSGFEAMNEALKRRTQS